MKRRSEILTTAFGIVLAAFFLFFTFRNVDVNAAWNHIKAIPPGHTFGLAFLSLAALATRGFRWWLLLPPPVRRGDLSAAMRALTLGYGVTNVASRLGELVRMVVFSRDSNRDLGSVASSVVVDRMVFDFLAFASFFAFALFGFRNKLLYLFPQLEPAFYLFLLVTVIGIASLVFLAIKPQFFQKLVKLAHLEKLPLIGPRLQPLISRLSEGVMICAQPRRMILLLGFNVIVWGLSVLYFIWGMSACGIAMDLKTGVLLFTISSFGIILPSPGGLGSFHYFVAVSCVWFLGVEETMAAAAATYVHGINYFSVSLAAVVCFFWKPSRSSQEKAPTIDLAETEVL